MLMRNLWLGVAVAAMVSCSGGSGKKSGTGPGGTGSGTGTGTETGSGVGTGTGSDTGTTRGGPVDDSAHAAAKQLFASKCSGCHQGAKRKAPLIGPGYNSRSWIQGFLANPRGNEYFGTSGIDKMKPAKFKGDDLKAVVEFVYSQTGAADADAALAKKGASLFDDGVCSNCHSVDGTTTGDPCPNLGGRGSVAYLAEFIADPGSGKFFGSKRNEMPAFKDKLSPEQIKQLAAWIHSLKDHKK
jgi:mono/diheme cytochrome c family protein